MSNLNKKELALLARFLESEQGKKVLNESIEKAVNKAVDKFNKMVRSDERDKADWWKNQQAGHWEFDTD